MNRVKRYFLDLHLRKKVIVTYLFASIVPITILGFYCYYQTKLLLINQERENLKKSFLQAGVSMETSINKYNNLANYTTFNPQVIDAVNRRYKSYYEMYDKFNNVLSPYINMLKSLHNEVKQITIYTDNDIVKHSDYIIPMKDITNTKWYQKVKDEYKFSWFSDGQGEVFGVLPFVNTDYMSIHNIFYIRLDYETFFQPFYYVSSKDSGVYILNKNKEIIFENNNFEGKKDFFIPSSEIEKEQGNEIKYKNTKYALIKMDIQGTGWSAYLYKPVELIVESTRNIVYTVLTIVGICLMILFVLGYGMSYVVVNRIEKLTENMQNMDVEHMEVMVTSDAKDEIGILIQSFGKMITKIQTLIHEVYKSEIAKRKYEMKALQAQINPHFLYNSLSLINWKAIRAGEDEISEMTQLLSTFFRTSLNKGCSIVTVEDELKNTKSYVDIQLIMHNHNFTVDYDIEEGITDYYMINLLLQPLVENAIAHGIDQKRNNMGHLNISARFLEKDIVFTVEDNGKGMETELCDTILTIKTKGYGVKNVHDRIRLTYGESYGLRYESVPNIGTKVNMRLPAIKDKSGLIE